MTKKIAVATASFIVLINSAAFAADNDNLQEKVSQYKVYTDNDPEYKTPTHFKSQYYPNEDQGNFGYHDTENSAQKQAPDQGYYNYYY